MSGRSSFLAGETLHALSRRHDISRALIRVWVQSRLEPARDRSTLSKNRNRLLEGEVAAKLLNAVLAQPRAKRLLSTDHFSVDGTLIEA